MTSPTRTPWVLDSAIDHLGLEQFATSIAALAQADLPPLAVLEQVMATIVDNLNSLGSGTGYSIEQLMHEKAAAYGFASVADFHQSLVKLIAERMVDLQISQLNAEQRRLRLGQERLQKKSA